MKNSNEFEKLDQACSRLIHLFHIAVGETEAQRVDLFINGPIISLLLKDKESEVR